MKLRNLPPYIEFIDSNPASHVFLRTPAEDIDFPLGEDDKKILLILQEKFQQEENCAGLAAPQLGFNKRALIFCVPDTPELKKWRPDTTDTMEQTLWINPTYKGVGSEKIADYEACFSVPDKAGLVSRFSTVEYTAFNEQGLFIKGYANGYLARVIQHEIDHLNGILFIDLVEKGHLLSLEEYRQRRKARLES